MNKRFIHISLVIVATVIVGVVGYLTLSQNSSRVPAKPSERTCPKIHQPVCGVDGNTYGNACFAELDRVAVQYDGVCKKEEQPTTSTEEPTRDWATFNHKKYNYSFEYPKEYSVGGNQYATEPEEGFSVFVASQMANQNQIHFNIEARDLSIYPNNSEMEKTIKLPLKEFVKKVWQQNIEDKNPNTPNKEVGAIEQTTFLGKTAYQFTLDGSYQRESGGYVLERKHTYLFVENNGLKYVIWFPVDNEVSAQILRSLRFVIN